MTLHSAFSIATEGRERVLQADKIQRFAKVGLIIIDEISICSFGLLAHVYDRVKAICAHQNTVGFFLGDIPVVLCGDFNQLPPVAGVSILKAVLEGGEDVRRRAHQAVRRDLADWFCSFRLHRFQVQQRAINDPDHSVIVETLRSLPVGQPVPATVLEYVNQHCLTARDLATPKWGLDATFVVPSQTERAAINKIQAFKLATSKNLPIITWQRTLVNGHHNRFDEDVVLLNPGIVEYFVPGAPALLDNNINPARGLANGTALILEGLFWQNDDERLAVIQKCNAVDRPAIIDITSTPPDAVIVRAPKLTRERVGVSAVEDGTAVFPLFRRADREWKVTKPDGSMQKLKLHTYGFELAFALTFHKVQGQTLDAVALVLDHRVSLPRLTFETLLVGLSRVRTGRDLRVLDPGVRRFGHLAKLKMNPIFHIWLSMYENGSWRRRPDGAFALPVIRPADSSGSDSSAGDQRQEQAPPRIQPNRRARRAPARNDSDESMGEGPLPDRPLPPPLERHRFRRRAIVESSSSSSDS